MVNLYILGIGTNIMVEHQKYQECY